jgi:HEAT repeat protein
VRPAGRTVKERLIAIMATDPYPAIRLAAVRASAARFPADPGVLAATESAMNDRSLPVMLEAVRILGEKGTAFLLDLLVNRKGLRHLEVIEIVEAVAVGPKVPGAAGVLEKVFMKIRRPAVRKAILSAFTTLGDTSAGPFLAGQLDRFDSDILAGIIEALGTCGTVDAVGKLHAALNDTINPFARAEIEKSIASIQSRQGADRGWLSVSESAPLEGALSPGGIEKGALSLDNRKK